MRSILYLIVLLSGVNPAVAEFRPAVPLTLGDPVILPVEEAFQFSALKDGDVVELRWVMPAGYYLYRHAFDVRNQAGDIVEFEVPEGKKTTDEFFGDVEIYYAEVILEAMPASDQPIRVRYQGCADAGYCYPPKVASYPAPAAPR